MSEGKTQESGPVRRWRKNLLIGSLALNFAVVGVVIGAKFGGRHAGFGHPEKRWAGEFGMMPFWHALPAEARRELGHRMRADRGNFAERRAENEAFFRQLLVALSAQPYDRGAVQALMQAQNRRVQEAHWRSQALLLEVIDGLTPQQRAAFVAELSRLVDARRGGEGL